jgi:hypothetical protein
VSDEKCGCDSGCGCDHEHGDHGHGHERDHGHGVDEYGDVEHREEGPPDPQLSPEQSPGFGVSPEGLAEIDVGRDVTLGEASLEDLTVGDTSPLAGTPVEEVVADLLGGDPPERRRAALALAETPPADATVAALARALAEDDDDEVRQFAVESLAKLGGDGAAEAAESAVDDDDPWVRAEAVVALDRLDRERFEDTLERALDDDHHAVRRNAAISLFKLRGEAALPILLSQADDPSERVREWAVHLLGGVDDDDAEATLRRVAGDDEEVDVVRSTAARALEADPGTFRRQFTSAIDEGVTDRPEDGVLNSQPDL